MNHLWVASKYAKALSLGLFEDASEMSTMMSHSALSMSVKKKAKWSKFIYLSLLVALWTPLFIWVFHSFSKTASLLIAPAFCHLLIVIIVRSMAPSARTFFFFTSAAGPAGQLRRMRRTVGTDVNALRRRLDDSRRANRRSRLDKHPSETDCYCGTIFWFCHMSLSTKP